MKIIEILKNDKNTRFIVFIFTYFLAIIILYNIISNSKKKERYKEQNNYRIKY